MVRSLISLGLILHLFCVLAAVLATIAPLPSPLLTKLDVVLRPYVQVLNFDLEYAPYYLTYATETDVDHRIEILPEGKDAANPANWTVLPDAGLPGSDRRRRYQRLAKQMANYAESEEVAGKIARDVAAAYWHETGIVPTQIRCRRHLLQEMEIFLTGTDEQRDPNSDVYFRSVYAANVLISDKGQVDLIKIDARGQVAPADPGEN